MPALQLTEYTVPNCLILERNDEIYQVDEKDGEVKLFFLFETDNKTYSVKSGLAFMLRLGFNPLKENYDDLSTELILEAFDGKDPFDTYL